MFHWLISVVPRSSYSLASAEMIDRLACHWVTSSRSLKSSNSSLGGVATLQLCFLPYVAFADTATAALCCKSCQSLSGSSWSVTISEFMVTGVGPGGAPFNFGLGSACHPIGAVSNGTGCFAYFQQSFFLYIYWLEVFARVNGLFY